MCQMYQIDLRLPADWVTEWQTKQLFVPVCIRGNYRHGNNLAFHLFSHITQRCTVGSGRRHCATSAARDAARRPAGNVEVLYECNADKQH